MNKKKLLAARIYQELERQNMTKTELAKRLGVFPSEVTRITSGKSNLSVRRLFQIEDVLQIQLFNIYA